MFTRRLVLHQIKTTNILRKFYDPPATNKPFQVDFSLAIDQVTPNGVYFLSFYISDNATNEVEFETRDLATKKFPYEIKVINPKSDTQPPELRKITPLMPSVLTDFTIIDQTTTPELVLELELFDDFSGVGRVKFALSCLGDAELSIEKTRDPVTGGYYPRGGIAFKTNATFNLLSARKGQNCTFVLNLYENRKFGNDITYNSSELKKLGLPSFVQII